MAKVQGFYGLGKWWLPILVKISRQGASIAVRKFLDKSRVFKLAPSGSRTSHTFFEPELDRKFWLIYNLVRFANRFSSGGASYSLQWKIPISVTFLFSIGFSSSKNIQKLLWEAKIFYLGEWIWDFCCKTGFFPGIWSPGHLGRASFVWLSIPGAVLDWLASGVPGCDLQNLIRILPKEIIPKKSKPIGVPVFIP